MCIFRSTKLWATYLYRYLKTHKYAQKQQASNITTNSLNITQNSVIVSQSHDIFENLAFEDWLYKNYDLMSRNISILLIWYNGPCVVIGRHQNPWVECSVDFCEANGINVVRRYSGGGTVYHDFGNLNFSFLTSPKNYNRKSNLELICEAIRRRWQLSLSVSKRDDILYNDEYKEGVKSLATSSTRAKVINLNSVCENIDTFNVIRAVADYYKQIYEVNNKNVLCLHPNENICPGLNKIKEELQSWQWRFGRTPLFEIRKTFPVMLPNTYINGNNHSFEVLLKVNKGVIESISLNPNILEKDCFEVLCNLIVGTPFSNLIHVPLEKWVKLTKDGTVRYFVKNCIMDMVSSVFR